jgi:hypothetical protein
VVFVALMQGCAGVRAIVEVQVRDNNVDQALRALSAS